MKIRRHAAAVLVLTVSGMVVTGAGRAQEMMVFSSAEVVERGPGESDGSLTRGQFTRYMEILALDAAQRESGEALFDAYVGERRDAALQMRERMSELKAEAEDADDWTSMLAGFGKVTEEFQEKAEALETDLLSDLGLLLTGRQSDNWARVERARRRDKDMRHAAVAGATVDLTRVAERMEFDDAAAGRLAEQLDAYEADIDRILIERDRLKGSVDHTPGRMLKFDAESMQAMNELMERMRETAIRLRDTNRRHARAIESEISEGRRAEFRERINMESFPRVYGEAHADRVIKAVLGFDDLGSEQRAAVGTIVDMYRARRPAIDVRWADAIEEADESGSGGVGFGGMKFQIAFDIEEEDGESPLAAARDARRELDRSTIRKIRDLLDEEQRSRLPKRSLDKREGAAFGTMRMIGG